jgi:hypothetical protein
VIRHEFVCSDGVSKIRVEENGRVRLILRPEERVILLGQWSEGKNILILFKNRETLVKKSFSLAVPLELWDGLRGGHMVQTVCCQMRDTGRLFCADRSMLTLFGYTDDDGVPREQLRQRYLFLDPEHWSEVSTLEDVIFFNDDRKAKSLADKQSQREGRCAD